MKRAKVYFLMESEDYDEFGFAFSPANVVPKEIQNWNESKEWEVIQLELRDGAFSDYLVNDLNIPLCSLRLKEVIHINAKNRDAILWFPVEVKSSSEAREYYYLKVSQILKDVIDVEKSDTQNNTIFNPYFVEEKIEDIFRCDFDLSYLFVSEQLKNSIEKEKLSGISFETWE
jgi:hypothetical protein